MAQQIFDAKTVTPDQMKGLVNTPGESLGATNSEAALQTAQNMNPSPNIPVFKIAPASPVVIPPATATPDYSAILASVVGAQGKVDTTEKKLEEDTKALGGKSADQATLETQDLTGAGSVASDKAGLRDLNAQLVSLNNEANAAKLKVENQPIELGSIHGQQATIERERTIKALGISSQIQAMNGNLTTANEAVTRSITLKYDPIKAEIDQLNKQLTYNYKNLTEAQKEKADAIKAENAVKLKELTNKEAQEKEWGTTRNTALANGAPVTVVQRAQALKDAGNETGARALLSNYTGTKGNQVVGYDAKGNPVYQTPPKKTSTFNFNTTSANLQKNGIPVTALSKTGDLSAKYRKDIVNGGVTGAQTDWLWKAVKDGNTFEDIRTEIKQRGADPKILDTFVQALQK